MLSGLRILMYYIAMVIMIEELRSRTYILGRAPVCTSRSQFSEEDSFHAAFFFQALPCGFRAVGRSENSGVSVVIRWA